jgi:hypothetical protein
LRRTELLDGIEILELAFEDHGVLIGTEELAGGKSARGSIPLDSRCGVGLLKGSRG